MDCTDFRPSLILICLLILLLLSSGYFSLSKIRIVEDFDPFNRAECLRFVHRNELLVVALLFRLLTEAILSITLSLALWVVENLPDFILFILFIPNFWIYIACVIVGFSSFNLDFSFCSLCICFLSVSFSLFLVLFLLLLTLFLFICLGFCASLCKHFWVVLDVNPVELIVFVDLCKQWFWVLDLEIFRVKRYVWI